MQRYKEIVSAGAVTRTLFSKSRSEIAKEYRPIFIANAQKGTEVPLQTEDSILAGCLGEIIRIRNRGGLKNIGSCKTYWDNQPYNPLEIYSLSIQFFDDHNEPLPKTVIPPHDDISLFIEKIKNSNTKLGIPEQLSILLDISKASVIGAANIGLVATRLMARGSDLRAYPIDLKTDDLKLWNEKVSQFETYDNTKVNDGPGDTYYFWTHFFAAVSLGLMEGKTAKVMNRFFAYGTDIMTFVRKNIVSDPTVTPHNEASKIGRNVGLAVADLLKT